MRDIKELDQIYIDLFFKEKRPVKILNLKNLADREPADRTRIAKLGAYASNITKKKNKCARLGAEYIIKQREAIGFVDEMKDKYNYTSADIEELAMLMTHKEYDHLIALISRSMRAKGKYDNGVNDLKSYCGIDFATDLEAKREREEAKQERKWIRKIGKRMYYKCLAYGITE